MPDSQHYVPQPNLTVIDSTTGLQWMRCAMGQIWDPQHNLALGKGEKLTWYQALLAVGQLNQGSGLAGYTDWRLPSLPELQTLCSPHHHPKIDPSAFPGSPPFPFWTMTPFAGYANAAWFLYFHTGYGSWGRKSYPFRVRLVRDADVTRPPSL